MIQRLLTALGYKSASFSIRKIADTKDVQTGERSYEESIRAFYKSSVAATCVSIWTRTLNEAPLYAIENEEQQLQHPLSLLFRKPNTYQSQATFWQTVSLFLALGGNCYIHKVRNATGRTIELHCYNDSQITPVPSLYEPVGYYEYNYNNVKQQIPKRDILHLRSHLLNPSNPTKGLSPFAVIAPDVDAQHLLNSLVVSTLDNGGVSTTWLKYQGDGFLDNEQVTSLKEQYNDIVKRRKTVGILGADIGLLAQGQSFKDLDIPNVWSKQEISICAAFGIPVIVAQTFAGMQNSTYNNVKESYKQFTDFFRIPVWNAWEDEIQSSFNDEYVNVDVEFDLKQVQALQVDAKEKADNILKQVQAGIVSPDEARSLLGYPPIEGNRITTTLSSLPPLLANAVLKVFTINEQRAIAGLPPIDGGDVVNTTSTVATASKRLTKGIEQYGITEQKATDIWGEYATYMDEAESALIVALSDSFSKLEKFALNIVKEKAQFDFEKWAGLFVNATDSARETLIKKVIRSAWKIADDVGDLGDAENNIFVDATLESAAKIKEAVQTTLDEITELLRANAGRTAKELETILKGKFETLKDSRVKLIARTTSTSSTTGTQRKVWNEYNKRQSDPKKKFVRVWLSSRDKKTRSGHSKLDGTPENETGLFKLTDASGNEHWTDRPAGAGLPASEACNCRCTTIAVRANKVKR